MVYQQTPETYALTPCSFVLKEKTLMGIHLLKKHLNKGAAFVIYDDIQHDPNHQNAILVEDSLSTLQELAHYHRNQFDIPVIGLTGSNGKTTTKELIKHVLAQSFEVLATKEISIIILGYH